MPLLHLFLVAIVQGITEFLPVSSSGHLILLPALTGLEDQGQAIDVAVHVGTLGAVMLYFRRDVAVLWRGTGELVRGGLGSKDSYLALCLGVATVPVVVAGLALTLTGLDDALRSAAVIAWATLIFGLVLWWADRTGAEARTAGDWTLRHAVVMGLWQAVALIPGTSRSGITITGARRLGYARHDAARLAMLMSIPTILAAGAVEGVEVIAEADTALLRDGAIAAALAFGSALAALAFMMRLLRSVSFTPYVVYRCVLGVGLLVWVYA
jgi:undecaprenyl-diphosphatase